MPSTKLQTSVIDSVDPEDAVVSDADNPFEVIIKSFIYLKHNIHCKALLQTLLSMGTLTENECKEVTSCSTELCRCEKLLKTVIRKGPHACSRFLSQFERKEFSHIAEKVRDNYYVSPRIQTAEFSLTKEHLQHHRSNLLNHIDPQLISDHLLQDGTISIDFHDEVNSHETTRQRSICLLDKLQEGSQSDLDNFLRACQITKSDEALLEVFRSDQEIEGIRGNNVACVRWSYRYLGVNIDPPEMMLERLYSQGFFTEDQYQLIRSEIQKPHGTGNLVKRVIEEGDDACKQMLFGVKNRQDIYDHVVSKARDRIHNGRRGNQNEFCLNDLKTKEKFLQEEMGNPAEVANILLEEGVFTPKDHDEVFAAQFRTEKCRRLLNKIFISRNRDAASSFIYALEEVKFPVARMTEQSSASTSISKAIRVICEEGVVSSQAQGCISNCTIVLRIDAEGDDGNRINKVLIETARGARQFIEAPILEETAMEVDGEEIGSVIIYLRPITDDAVQNFLDQKEKAIQSVLSALFRHENVMKLIAGNETAVKVQVKGIDKEETSHLADTHVSLNLRGKLMDNFNFLTAELEILQMIPMFIKRKCFEEEKVNAVLKNVSGRRNIAKKFLTWMVNDTSDDVVDCFFEILRELDNTYILKRLYSEKDENLHEKAEKTRKGILDNYSLLLEELGSDVLEDTLKQCRDVPENVQMSTSPSSVKGRRNGVHEFLKFILRKDENVREFQKTIETANLQDLLKLKSTRAATPAKSSLRTLDLTEGVLLECSFRVTVEADGDQPHNMNKSTEQDFTEEIEISDETEIEHLDTNPKVEHKEEICTTLVEGKKQEMTKTKPRGKEYDLLESLELEEKKHSKDPVDPKLQGVDRGLEGKSYEMTEGLTPIYCQAPLVCELCNSLDHAKWYCDRCNANLCVKCYHQHFDENIKKYVKNHNLIPIEKALASKQSQEHCFTHKDEVYVLHCNTCRLLVCLTCITTGHKEHVFCHIKEAMTKIFDDINQHADVIEKSLLPQFDALHVKISENIKCCEDWYTTHEHLLQRKREELITEINHVCDELLQTLKREMEENMEPAQQGKALVETKGKELKSFLEAKDEIMKKRKSDIIQFSMDKPAIQDIALPIVRPVNLSVNMGTQIASLQVVNAFTASDKKQERETQHGQPTSVIDIQLLSKRKLRYSVDTIATKSPDTALVSCHHSKLLIQVDMNGKQTEIVNTKFLVSDFIIIESDDLMITHHEDKCVLRYSGTGEVIANISTDPYHPSGICLTKDRQFVVVCLYKKDMTNILHLYTKDGQLVRKINYTDRPSPDYYTMRVTTNDLGDFCVAHNGLRNVSVISNMGSLRFTYDGSTATEFTRYFCPCNIVCDKYNNLLVSDSHNNTIHMLDQEGQFLRYLLTYSHDGIVTPSGLHFDSVGNLWVGQDDGTLLVFKYVK